MKKKNAFAFFTVLAFASFMLLVSCGKNKDNAVTSERNVPDSALTDAIPASGENEYQSDQVPQGRTEQLDSLKDSVDRRPH
ncbi:MAG: hypothetical protein WDO14_22590 [Bacteroidota bacterium]